MRDVVARLTTMELYTLKSVAPRSVAVAILAAAIAIVPGSAMADAGSATASGQATARVTRPIAVNGIDNLDFGMIASSGSGTVIVGAASGVASYGGSARQACVGAVPCPQPHAARFEVTGERSRNYRISVPDELRIAGPGSERAVLLVSGFTVRSASQPDAGPHGRLDSFGSDSFAVGGTLNISATLPPGHYAVNIPVRVTYD